MSIYSPLLPSIAQPTSFSFQRRLSLSNLEEKDLYQFFLENNEIPMELVVEKNPKPQKPTDFVHFIWMGNPLKEDYKENILSWKRRYPDKEIIIWVDKDALEHEDLIDFAIDNNIKLIDLDEVFTDEYAFDLNELIRLEKNRLPPNWGAASDLYRYLIMYYFGGTYSDTDVDINKKLGDQEIDFDSNFSFNQQENVDFGNDLLVTKNLKEDFWKYVINCIKRKYNNPHLSSGDYVYSEIKHSRLKTTMFRTGPDCLLNCIKAYGLKNDPHVKFINIHQGACDFTWNANLTNEKCKKLAKDVNIVARIIQNVILDLKETDSLDLTKYDKIIEKISSVKRDEIIGKIKVEVKKLDSKDYKIENIFAKNIKEYEEFLRLIPKENQNIKSHARALKYAAYRRNAEMFKYLYEKYPDEIFSNNTLSKKILLAVSKIDPSFVTAIIERARQQNGKIDLEIDAAVLYFQMKPDQLFIQYKSIMLDKEQLSEEEKESILGQFEELLNVLTFEMLDSQNKLGENILHIAAQSNDDNFIKIIRKVFVQKQFEFLFNMSLEAEDSKSKKPIDYCKNDKMRELFSHEKLRHEHAE